MIDLGASNKLLSGGASFEDPFAFIAAQEAAEVGIGSTTAHRILADHKIAPHRMREFKVSTDPDFAKKPRAAAGLYMNPPDRAVVLSIDEETQIQALGRTRKGLPMKPGQPATMTHDYKRNGTVTLFAALNTMGGTVIGRHAERRRHQEFIECRC